MYIDFLLDAGSLSDV